MSEKKMDYEKIFIRCFLFNSYSIKMYFYYLHTLTIPCNFSKHNYLSEIVASMGALYSMCTTIEHQICNIIEISALGMNQFVS